ncbi:MAG: hypothetical protein CM1200mP40_19720 [Gammaproteobacteria bacterium]|nr:MAG: hypothetical protein CM1200mP40_19720 [Gammaproteobacteria bacterium]
MAEIEAVLAAFANFMWGLPLGGSLSRWRFILYGAFPIDALSLSRPCL